MILIDSVLKKDDKYYPQVFLEECKYIIKEKKKHRYFKEELEISSDKSDKKVTKNLKKNLIKNILKLINVIVSFLRE